MHWPTLAATSSPLTTEQSNAIWGFIYKFAPTINAAAVCIVIFAVIRAGVWPLTTTTGGTKPGPQRWIQAANVTLFAGLLVLTANGGMETLLAPAGRVVSMTIDTIHGLIT